ncbi:hypothetical protein ACOSQ4_009790 [Xanthoceras sorbifolium]
METILVKDTFKQIWDSMKMKYKGMSRVKRAQLQALRTEFETLYMQQGESVSTYFSRMMGIANKMRINGDKMEDIAIIEKILHSMTAKFDYVVCSIEESNDLDDLSIDELESTLLVHELRINKHAAVDQALELQLPINNTSMGRRGSGRGRGRDRGRGRERRYQRGVAPAQQPPDISQIRCYRCNKYGHFSYDCVAMLPEANEEKSHLVEEDEEVKLRMVSQATEEHSQTMWYLDSGASNHMCGDQTLFSELDDSFRSTVKLGDNSKLPVLGKGTIHIRNSTNSHISISHVFYVPDLTSNLLSAGQLQENDFEIIIKKGICCLQHPDKGIIARIIITHNRMFPYISIMMSYHVLLP